MSMQTTLGPMSPATLPAHGGGTKGARSNSALWRAIGLLKCWRERMRSRQQVRRLCDLDDHLLQDIGLTRTALLSEVTRPFWR